jgi:tetratricopeptide (TPR) repeat protein
VEDSHLSLEVLALWLSNRLEHEDVLAKVVPHLMDSCGTCRERFEEIGRLQEEIGHWDETVAVFESRQAPELLAELTGRPFEQQLQLVEEREEMHVWGFCRLLLRQSQEAVFDDPLQAVDLADLAVRIAGRLDDGYDPNWVLDLRAQAWAQLGNARRVVGELRSAEDAFRRAEGFLARSTSGNTQAQAEIYALKSSLRRDQRRLKEALGLAAQALALYRENQNSHGIGKLILSEAKILEEMGDLEGAIHLLEQSPAEIDAEADPRLFACARFNLLGCLTLAGRHDEAERLLPEVQGLFRESAQPLDRVRLTWAEGSIALGRGRTGDAEALFRQVQGAFLERGMGYDAALVSLDLAILYAQEGRTAEIKQLAVEVMPAFESREVQREAMAALLMFQQACEEERLTVQLARQIAAFLKRERIGRGV